MNTRTQDLQRFTDTLRTACLHTLDTLPVEALNAATDLITSARAQGNRIHITGIGKPSHLAGYVASLFSSVGVPCYYLHGTEAVHGSCGQLETGDVVVCISNSGETSELRATVLAAKNNGAHIIGVTGNPNSWLATNSEVTLLADVAEEGGVLNRAPRASIIAETLVLQALSVLIQSDRQITPAEYVLRHPGGKLGQLRDNEK